MFRGKAPDPSFLRLLRAALIFLVFAPRISFAQSLNFRNYSVDDGLPFVQVFTIFQDSKGYLWSGGYGGLSRFDGRTFTNFSPSNGGLPNHWVTSITEDSRGDLWVGTIEGASRYSEGVFTNYSEKDGLPSEYVNCLLRDERDMLWFGTAKGLCRYDGQKFSGMGDDGPGKASVLCFFQEPNTGRIWMGTSRGVYKYENHAFTHYPFSPFLDSTVTAITRDAEGHIIAGTADGLFRFGNGHFELMLTPPGFEMPAVADLVSDRFGMTWIAADNGLFSFDGKNFRQYDVSGVVGANSIISLYVDYEGSLWLGTHAGLFRYRGEGFISYTVKDGLESNFVFGITEDRAGTLWVCTETNGVYRYDGKTFSSLAKKEGLASDESNACMLLPDGDVLVGTDNGLSRITEKGKITNFRRADGLHSDSVNCMLRDHRGRVWLGGGKGLTLYEEDGTFTQFIIPSGPEESFDVWYLHEDRRGTIWVGTYNGGLYTFDGKTFTDADAQLGMMADSYFSICEDRRGKLYFGTLDGVFIYDPHSTGGKAVDRLSESDGMSSELVYCMIIDNPGRYLWIGTNQGLARFDIETYNKSGSKIVSTYGKEEGFTGVETNSNGAYIDRRGMIWFGTVNGLVRYSEKDFRHNPAYAKTSITGVRLFYNKDHLPPDVELEYDMNNVSFEYVGICLTNPAKVRYQYMLAGFDTGWSPPTADRVARYSNLPPGTYTFKVISCNNEGLWNPEPVTYSFTINTPVWKRPWFWLLLTGVSVLILSLAIVYRIRQIKKKERIETEAQVAMARNELKALRAQMNPHFVFNSLNSIQHFILTNKSADAGKYLNKFARLMRVILNNSEKSLITIREELEYLQLYLELEEMRFEGKFSWSVDVSKDIDMDYFEIPAMLLQPYVENAILHGLMPKSGGGKLQIVMRLQGNTIVCSIIDDGIGREKAWEMRQLSKRKDHQSLGMKITHDRLELINRLHGSQLSLTITDLYAEDGSAAGTRVDIFIPVS